MSKIQQHQQAWNTLMSLNKRHYVSTGFYALGDAYLISGKDPKYKNIIVLVEHRQKAQINHWETSVKNLNVLNRQSQLTVTMVTAT
ncbi:hypothetical protein [Nostoc sp. MG11]|uniref:hypothetical protein n=1 Tax=Nostoc sp. MG11 TaxID=2721166 RepID=UPI0018670628|nr:hypothetical protein [Nostoc sp. MG11]